MDLRDGGDDCMGFFFLRFYISIQTLSSNHFFLTWVQFTSPVNSSKTDYIIMKVFFSSDRKKLFWDKSLKAKILYFCLFLGDHLN